MLKAAFILLRVLTAIASLGALAGTILIIVVDSTVVLLKGGAYALVSIAKLFASGFQKSSPTPPVPQLVSLPMMGLAILFLTMFTSVFMPGQKIFLHIVAAMAVIAAIWRIWVVAHTHDTNSITIFYLPVIALWFIYYGVSLRRV